MDLPRRTLLAALAGSLAPPMFRVAAAASPELPKASAPSPAPPAPRPVALTAAAVQGSAGRLSYDASVSGPVVRVRRGEALAVSLRNTLDQPTSLQWHGLRGTAGDADTIEGATTVAPGATLTQTIRAAESGFSWFHPAARPGEAGQTAAGLRGILVVEEVDPPTADLDLLLVIEEGPGATLRVNGVAAPGQGTIPTGGRLRLRLLNATTSRILPIGIVGARPQVISIDGQPSNLFPPLRDTVPLGPGARFELMMDASREPGGRLAVVLRPAPTGSATPAPSDLPLYELAPTGDPRPSLPAIAPLPPNPALPPMIPLERATRARLAIAPVPGAAAGKPQWMLNGSASLDLPRRPLFSVKAGDAVTLAFENRGSAPVPVRVHGQAMRLLHAKDDGWEPYWRESVILPPGIVTLVAFVPDTPGRWLIDSAVAEQAAAGLRSFFEVTGGLP